MGESHAAGGGRAFAARRSLGAVHARQVNGRLTGPGLSTFNFEILNCASNSTFIKLVALTSRFKSYKWILPKIQTDLKIWSPKVCGNAFIQTDKIFKFADFQSFGQLWLKF